MTEPLERTQRRLQEFVLSRPSRYCRARFVESASSRNDSLLRRLRKAESSLTSVCSCVSHLVRGTDGMSSGASSRSTPRRASLPLSRFSSKQRCFGANCSPCSWLLIVCAHLMCLVPGFVLDSALVR